MKKYVIYFILALLAISVIPQQGFAANEGTISVTDDGGTTHFLTIWQIIDVIADPADAGTAGDADDTALVIYAYGGGIVDKLPVDDTAATVRTAIATAYAQSVSNLTVSGTLIFDACDASGAVDMDYGSADITDHTFTTDGGAVIIDGTITQDAGTTLFMGGLLDATGAVDMDYGSADITDHTFTTDGGTATIDGSITSDGTVTAGVGFDITGAADLDIGSGDVLDVTVTTDGGAVVLDGSITQDAGTTLFMGGLLDATGAVDMDYGSADITDHTFVSDGGTAIIDGNITMGSDAVLDATGAVDMDYGSADVTDHTFTSDGGTVILDGGVTATGIRATAQQTATLGAAATTFGVTSNVITLTGDGGGNTIATITGGVDGMLLTIICVDANITFTDTDAAAANKMDLPGVATDITSADDKVIQLVYDGTSWFCTSVSTN